ncbi:MAG: hypothetical protein AB1758_14150, partial [Candidatus Eremiobacterota bacterium]
LKKIYEQSLIVYTWDPASSRLVRRTWSSGAPAPGLTLSALNPTRLSPAVLDSFASAPGGTLLGRSVTGLRVDSPFAEPNLGSPLTLTVEVRQQAVSGRVERFQLMGRVDLRNPF